MPALRQRLSTVNDMSNWFPVAATRAIPLKQMDESDGANEWLSPERCKSILEHGPKQRAKGNSFHPIFLDESKPWPTIPKTRSGNGSLYFSNGTAFRYPTIDEMKYGGSYPSSFVFAGNAGNVANRIGNSVPPLFMRSIAINIKSMLQTGQPIRQGNKLKKITNYPAHLEACWQEHLAPRAADAPTVVSTFAGAGGSSLGYSMAGFRELLAVEWDNNAVETFKLNFPDVPVYHGDIAKLSVEEVLSMTGLQPGQLDVFDGSPPCQGFSTAGKRNFADSRNQLFHEYVRLLRGLKPKVFVMENVSGMVKGKMKLIFAEILRELKASGYKVSARLLNAMYFGVPQSRQRMIFIGVREDLGIEPSHPVAEQSLVSVASAWNGLSFKGLELTHTAARIVGKMKPGEKGKTFAPQCGNEFLRLEWNKPSPTILKNFRLSGAIGLVHPTVDKHIGIQEAKRLATFPDSFAISGNVSAQWARIGNSVPPLMMRSIANHLREQILGRVPELVGEAITAQQ